jgi:hypothetical protein
VITFLSTAQHKYTHDVLKKTGRFEFKSLSYNSAFRAKVLPRGTYVFADADRLGFWELELAARLYRVLQAAGVKVLNDPATLRQRYSLLRELHHQGFNRFTVWQADDSSRPARYPVFLRTQSAHRGTLSELLDTEEQIQDAIRAAVAKGIPMRELILVEYCAEPLRPGLFRKLATFRVGDRMVSTTCVHESHWSAKYGELGIAPQDVYDDEYAIVSENRWGEPLRKAFEIAGAQYGRVDFALVGGQPQAYEINTNPMHDRITRHPFPIRVKADETFYQRFYDAICEIDTDAKGAAVAIDDKVLTAQRKHDRWVVRGRWSP